MSQYQDSILLAPNFTLVVRWSARVADFVEEWQQRQACDRPGQPPAFWAEATSMALSGVEQGRQCALDVLADLYYSSRQLPAPSDKLLLGALELKVDQRHFVTRRVAGDIQVEVQYYLGVEAFRYTGTPLPRISAN